MDNRIDQRKLHHRTSFCFNTAGDWTRQYEIMLNNRKICRICRIWNTSTQHMEHINPAQLAYRWHHSTETSLLRQRMLRTWQWIMEMQPSWSLWHLGGFWQVAHSTLLQRLGEHFRSWRRGTWTDSVVHNRTRPIQIASETSKPTCCNCGVPQGSVLVLNLFTVYTSPIAKVADAHGVSQQQYADDTHYM